MKRPLISAFVICLATAAPTTLWAQEKHHDQAQGGEQGGSKTRTPDQHATRTPEVNMNRGNSGSATMRMRAVSQHHRATAHVTTTHVNSRIRETSHVKVDIKTYHKNITAERRFHYGDYRAPPGYAYRRWSYGERLPQEYFVRDYWISNYLNFGLPWAPDGYVWVRFGPDALLIDESTGEIVQVDYGVFY